MESQHQQGMDTDKHLSYMTPAVLYTETGIKKINIHMQHAGIRQKKTNLHSLLSVLGKGSEKSALNLYFSSEALPCRELAV